MSYYRIYKELTDKNGEVVHKCPVAHTKSLSAALRYARAWRNALPVGIYKVSEDGNETKVMTI